MADAVQAVAADRPPGRGRGGVGARRGIDESQHSDGVPGGEAVPRALVALLGGFALRVDGQDVVVPAAIERAIAYLALRGRCGRSRLAGTLWPEHSEERALGNLRTAMWRVNQVAPGVVIAEHDSLALAPDVEVDVALLVTAAHEVLGGADLPVAAPTLRYVEGDLLPDWTDDWLTVDRERLRQLRLHVLEAIAGRLAARGLFGMALEAALAALRSDPLRESAHRAVISIHLAEGNLAEAVQAYRQCRALLAREVGVAPSPETVRLMATFRTTRTTRAVG